MRSIDIESSAERRTTGEFAAAQDAIDPDAELISIDALTTEIATVIDDTDSPHQHEYIVEEVADYGVSSADNVHFELVHREKERPHENDDRLHCIIYRNRRADITASISEGKRVAVVGALTFHAPRVARSKSMTWSLATVLVVVLLVV